MMQRPAVPWTNTSSGWHATRGEISAPLLICGRPCPRGAHACSAENEVVEPARVMSAPLREKRQRPRRAGRVRLSTRVGGRASWAWIHKRQRRFFVETAQHATERARDWPHVFAWARALCPVTSSSTQSGPADARLVSSGADS
jgi:hypothetical protein